MRQVGIVTTLGIGVLRHTMSDAIPSVEALLEAHELIIVEREDAKEQMEDNEFANGHINGLNEARNRVEQCIVSRVNHLECFKQEAKKDE